jgi:hypothetical protein
VTVPGSNLLRRASRLIKFQTLQYYQFNTRAQNAAFQEVSYFNAPFPLKASVQAVSRNTYAQLGLDLQRQYLNVFASLDMIDLDRDASGDQFIWAERPGQNWLCQLESETSWYSRDGWAECLAVRIAINQVPLVGP